MTMLLCVAALQDSSNARRLLAAESIYQVAVDSSNTSKPTEIEEVTALLVDVSSAAQPTNASEIDWCGDFCNQHASEIDVQKSGGLC